MKWVRGCPEKGAVVRTSEEKTWVNKLSEVFERFKWKLSYSLLKFYDTDSVFLPKNRAFTPATEKEILAYGN